MTNAPSRLTVNVPVTIEADAARFHDHKHKLSNPRIVESIPEILERAMECNPPLARDA